MGKKVREKFGRHPALIEITLRLYYLSYPTHGRWDSRNTNKSSYVFKLFIINSPIPKTINKSNYNVEIKELVVENVHLLIFCAMEY